MLNLDKYIIRRAGKRRANEGVELAEHVRAPMTRSEIIAALASGKPVPKMAGGGQEFLLTIVNPAALGAALTTYQGPLLSVPQDPLVLAVHYIPTIAAVTAASTMQFNRRRTDVPTVIGGGTTLTATAATQIGGLTFVDVVPPNIPAGSGIDCQASTSVGAGTITVSATAPMVLALLGIA